MTVAASSQTGDLQLAAVIDNSRGLQQVRASEACLRRTINLLFEERSSDHYAVRAWGNAFPDDGRGAYEGILKLNSVELYGFISELRAAWIDSFLHFQSDPAGRRFPFADEVDLQSPTYDQAIDNVMRKLARAGYKLFQLIFYSGDRGLAEIGDLLADSLRSRDQIISFHSEDLFAPWGMLYVPEIRQPSHQRIGIELEDPAAPWDYDGFLGYRHLIEHNLKRLSRSSTFEVAIPFAHQVKVGLNVDRNLDLQFPSAMPVEPVIRVFEARSSVTLRESRAELASALTSSDFADQLIYFCCHGVVSGAQHGEQARISLTDGEPISSSDFRQWLARSPLRTNPVVILNACQGGQMSSMFYASFSQVLLRSGANCLVGPQIDIPPIFARAYAEEFIPRILTPSTRMGDLVREMTQLFIQQHRNPLGLAITLYRGLDTHYSPAGSQL